MSFIRPELAAALVRRREVVIWGAMLALGLALVWRGYQRLEPLVFAVGIAASVAGFALLRGARARLRLAAVAAAPGAVVIDEGRIGLFGPQGGGFVDLPALVAVEITGGPGRPDRAWVLRTEDGAALVIPFGAAGAEALPDALAPLPGIDFAAADRAGATVWRRTAAAAGALALPPGDG